MENDTSDELYSIVFCTQHTLCSFSHHGISLRQNIIQSLSLSQSFLKLFCLLLQLIVRQFSHGSPIGFNLVDDGGNPL